MGVHLHKRYTDAEARAAAVSDAAYAAGWDGVTTIAPSKNAVYDKIETLGAATKEVIGIPNELSTDIAQGYDFAHGAKVDADNEYAYLKFHVPHDYTSITEAVVVICPLTTATHRCSFGAQYRTNGEAFNTHEEYDRNVDMSLTQYQFYEYDMSGILANLSADDYVDIRVGGEPVNTSNLLVVEVRLKYA